jgi:hypothetical protein
MTTITVFGTTPEGDPISVNDPLDRLTIEALQSFNSLEEAFRLGEIIGALKAFDSVSLDGKNTELVKQQRQDLRDLSSQTHPDKKAWLLGMAAVTRYKSSPTSELTTEPVIPPIPFQFDTKDGIFKVEGMGKNGAIFSTSTISQKQYDALCSWLYEFCGSPMKDLVTGEIIPKGSWVIGQSARRVIELSKIAMMPGYFTAPKKGEIFAGENQFYIEVLMPYDAAPAFQEKFKDWF